ncbi:hypothetical protein SALBM217S_02834 [Streptomyces griseoloalbus]
MAAEVVGSVVERELLDALFSKSASLDDPLEKHMCGAAAAGRLRRTGRGPDGRPGQADAAIVLVEGKPTGASAARTCWPSSPSPELTEADRT